MIYLLDTNFFIEAHKSTYPFDVVVSFWLKLKDISHRNQLISIDKVHSELNCNPDNLSKWCTEHLPQNFFKPTASIIATQYPKVANWANSKSQHYQPKAIAEFLDFDEADAFLISYALQDVENVTIVTREIANPTQKNKIKIPEVCNHFNVKFCTPIEMFRQLKETF